MSDTVVREWTEVRLIGQPPNDARPYEFVFRSDLHDDAARDHLLRRARADWSGVDIATRHVRVETTTTEWEPESGGHSE